MAAIKVSDIPHFLASVNTVKYNYNEDDEINVNMRITGINLVKSNVKRYRVIKSGTYFTAEVIEIPDQPGFV